MKAGEINEYDLNVGGCADNGKDVHQLIKVENGRPNIGGKVFLPNRIEQIFGVNLKINNLKLGNFYFIFI